MKVVYIVVLITIFSSSFDSQEEKELTFSNNVNMPKNNKKSNNRNTN